MLKSSNSRANLAVGRLPMAADGIVHFGDEAPDRSSRTYIINGTSVTMTLIGRDLQGLETLLRELLDGWGLSIESFRH
jgi:hypothetical protein